MAFSRNTADPHPDRRPRRPRPRYQRPARLLGSSIPSRSHPHLRHRLRRHPTMTEPTLAQIIAKPPKPSPSSAAVSSTASVTSPLDSPPSSSTSTPPTATRLHRSAGLSSGSSSASHLEAADFDQLEVARHNAIHLESPKPAPRPPTLYHGAFVIFTHPVPGALTAALLLFITASVTDYFDGERSPEARPHHRFGKLIDPVADKILAAAAFVCLIPFDLTPERR